MGRKNHPKKLEADEIWMAGAEARFMTAGYVKKTEKVLLSRLPDMIKPGLDLRVLQAVSTMRSQSKRGFNQKEAKWSSLEWGGAVAGEIGEACNIAKKLIRLRGKQRGNVKKSDQSEARLVKRLHKEIADGLLYLVLWIAYEKGDLSDSVVEVFNKKSKQLGYDFML